MQTHIMIAQVDLSFTGLAEGGYSDPGVVLADVQRIHQIVQEALDAHEALKADTSARVDQEDYICTVITGWAESRVVAKC